MSNVIEILLTETLATEHANMSEVVRDLKEEIPQKSVGVIFCPSCKNTSIEIVGRCATCLVCGWSLCNA